MFPLAEKKRRIKLDFTSATAYHQSMELDYIESTEPTYLDGLELRDIPGAKGKYKSGADGNIYSYVRSSRKWAEGGDPDKPRKMSLCPDNNGHLTTAIMGKHFKAHTLVILAWQGPKPAGMECRHKDGVKSNVRPDNLEYGTRSQNYWDSIRHGKPMLGNPTIDRKNAKLSPEQVNEIRTLIENGTPQRTIANIYGVKQPVISYIKSGSRKGISSLKTSILI
jgi:hypothetical protein